MYKPQWSCTRITRVVQVQVTVWFNVTSMNIQQAVATWWATQGQCTNTRWPSESSSGTRANEDCIMMQGQRLQYQVQVQTQISMCNCENFSELVQFVQNCHQHNNTNEYCNNQSQSSQVKPNIHKCRPNEDHNIYNIQTSTRANEDCIMIQDQRTAKVNQATNAWKLEQVQIQPKVQQECCSDTMQVHMYSKLQVMQNQGEQTVIHE